VPHRTRASSTAFVSLTATRTSPMPDCDRSNDQAPPAALLLSTIRTLGEPSERAAVARRILVKRLFPFKHESAASRRRERRRRAEDLRSLCVSGLFPCAARPAARSARAAAGSGPRSG